MFSVATFDTFMTGSRRELQSIGSRVADTTEEVVNLTSVITSLQVTMAARVDKLDALTLRQDRAVVTAGESFSAGAGVHAVTPDVSHRTNPYTVMTSPMLSANNISSDLACADGRNFPSDLLSLKDLNIQEFVIKWYAQNLFMCFTKPGKEREVFRVLCKMMYYLGCIVSTPYTICVKPTLTDSPQALAQWTNNINRMAQQMSEDAVTFCSRHRVEVEQIDSSRRKRERSITSSVTAINKRLVCIPRGQFPPMNVVDHNLVLEFPLQSLLFHEKV